MFKLSCGRSGDLRVLVLRPRTCFGARNSKSDSFLPSSAEIRGFSWGCRTLLGGCRAVGVHLRTGAALLFEAFLPERGHLLVRGGTAGVSGPTGVSVFFALLFTFFLFLSPVEADEDDDDDVCDSEKLRVDLAE